jgi:hypothetical protein
MAWMGDCTVMAQIIFNVVLILLMLFGFFFFWFKVKNDKKLKKAEEEKTNLETSQRIEKIMDIQTETFKLETNELKSQNMFLSEQVINEVETKLRSHYLTLLRDKTVALKKKVDDYIDALINSKDALISDYIDRDELEYLSVTMRKQHLTDKLTCTENSIDSFIQLLHFISESLDNYIQLPDFLIYEKQLIHIMGLIQKDISIRIMRNRFDERLPNDWKDYVDRAYQSFKTLVTTNLDQLYWHKSIISRVELYDYNQVLLSEIEEAVISLFDNMRLKTIEIKKQVKVRKEQIKQLK